MFDVSFFELLVIGVVALVVIGPERLPGAIKSCALWIGRMKRILAESRTEFEKHIGADEIRRELHNEEVMASLEKLKASRAALELDLLNYQNSLQAELNAIEHDVMHESDADHNEQSDLLENSEDSADLTQPGYTSDDSTFESESTPPAVSLAKPIKTSPAVKQAEATCKPLPEPSPSTAGISNTNTKHD